MKNSIDVRTQEIADPYEQYIYMSRYARYDWGLGRRERWSETVNRYTTHIENMLVSQFSSKRIDELLKIIPTINKYILERKVMPSMRMMMTAGVALERDNVAGYNCSYMAINSIRCFSEALYILMCGCGVGFSCEKEEVSLLPNIPLNIVDCSGEYHRIIVEDSREGWSNALEAYLNALFSGSLLTVDYSKIRPEKAILRTFGGRSAGAEPFKNAISFITEKIYARRGGKLSTLDVHDIMCMLGKIVVVGGVRRSALISLSDIDDDAMRHCKSGDWWQHSIHRSQANNSAIYESTPTPRKFLEEWRAIRESNSGERGIFNRQSAAVQAIRNGLRKEERYGTNPCGEIILRSQQFCNLTEVIARPSDDENTLLDKIKIASILGTIQSCMLKFPFLSDKWEKNTEEERLLGVSITGIMDNQFLNGTSKDRGYSLIRTLTKLKNKARETNVYYAKKLGIPISAAITCVKPSGTVSQLCGTASGIHPNYSEYYIRRVRASSLDPLTKYMQDIGVPCEDDCNAVGSSKVFTFYRRVSPYAQTRKDYTALESLEIWRIYKEYYCEHNPSVTISIREEEWDSVGWWMLSNFSTVCGISVLPYSDSSYVQLPYEEISKEQYFEGVKTFKDVSLNPEDLNENTDHTTAMQEPSCTSGGCEVF